ncbi:MAG: PilT protein domain protein [Bacteroidetes bacterium]|nr:PilT protein domain protein [Bacteroidota bacterium]
MSGSNVLLDTNAVLYLLGGRIDFKSLPAGVFHISCISEMELLSYPKLKGAEEQIILRFLEDVAIIELSPEIKSMAVGLRRRYRLRLPDAIIVATSIVQGAPLVTFDKTLMKIEGLQVLQIPLSKKRSI